MRRFCRSCQRGGSDSGEDWLDDTQRGAPGQALDQPIVIVVRDDQEEPAAGVRVSWIADDGGMIDPPESVTNSDGIATAAWTLGADHALHHGRALAPGYETVEFT